MKLLTNLAVPQFEINHAEAVFTVLIYCYDKALTWYGYHYMVTWTNFGHDKYLIDFGCILGLFRLTMFVQSRLRYAEASQKDKIRWISGRWPSTLVTKFPFIDIITFFASNRLKKLILHNRGQL